MKSIKKILLQFINIIEKMLENKIYVTTVAIIVLLYIIYMFSLNISFYQSKYSIKELEFEGSYKAYENNKTENLDSIINNVCYEKNSMKKIPSDYHIKLDEGDDIIIIGQFCDNIEKNENIFIEVLYLEVHVYQNGKEIYTYGDENMHSSILKSDGKSWIKICSEGISKEDNIVIVLNNKYRDNFENAYQTFFTSMCITDRGTLLINNVLDNIFNFIVGGLIIIYSVTVFFLSAAFNKENSESAIVVNRFSILMIILSVLIGYRQEFMSLIFDEAVFEVVLYTTTVILSINAALRFLKCFTGKRVTEIINIMEILSTILLFAFIILQCMGKIDAFEFRIRYVDKFLIVYFIIIIIIMLYSLLIEKKYMLSNDIKSEKIRKHKIFIVSGCIYTFFGVLEITNILTECVKPMLFAGIGVLVFFIIQSLVFFRNIEISIKKSESAATLEKMVTENKIAIMINQIQPHFLYNSIASIQMLCKKDSQKAMTALGSFADFLRGNMDSISSTTPITFEKELRHVENYLYLEKVRFQDMISVIYDIRYEDFLLPSLTIQPIVENAVKYGISDMEDGGTIVIATKEEKDNVVISITDNGKGFDMSDISKKNNTNRRTHVGMNNVKERIESISKGKFNVQSEIGKGTKVTIILPK